MKDTTTQTDEKDPLSVWYELLRVQRDLLVVGASVTLLDVDDELGVTPVQTLLIHQVLGGDGTAYWVDASGAADPSSRACPASACA
ncbi:hypothetical protein JCM17823_04940 [Halorubrum gandharaense]